MEMNIEIKDIEDLQGRLQTALRADPMSKQELIRLGVVIGRLISRNVEDNANRMAILKQIYTTAGWQIVHDTGALISEADEATAFMMLEEYIREIQEKNGIDEILLQ